MCQCLTVLFVLDVCADKMAASSHSVHLGSQPDLKNINPFFFVMPPFLGNLPLMYWFFMHHPLRSQIVPVNPCNIKICHTIF